MGVGPWLRWPRGSGSTRRPDVTNGDGYGTGLVVYVLRIAGGVPADAPAIRKAVEWIKTHQRQTGYWYTRSPKINDQLSTYVGTVYVILALRMRGNTVTTLANNHHVRPTRMGVPPTSEMLMKHTLSLLTALLFAPLAAIHAAETLLVEEGVPRAEIVVAEKRPRMVTLAALELRHFVQKMSGARLPIVTATTAGTQVKIHVGQSAETDRLGVTAQGLRDGAYRIVSGPDWLVLIGKDRDFDCSKLPWPLSRKDVPRATAAWAKATAGKTDAAWGFPFASGFKGFWNPKDFTAQMTARYGEDFSLLWRSEPGIPAGFWLHDEGGSLNAVYGLLRSLGVRWFMPGELGEVVPAKATISLGALNETVKPDYPVRDWNWYNFAGFAYDDIIWARRLGMNSCDELLGPNTGPHGLVPVLSAPAMQQAHPEYYALIGGKRDTAHRERGTPCFSSAGLEAETVRYIRFMFDCYDLPGIDIWPVDGLRLCQCEKCTGKSASELVWGFADRVARQVYRTHPGKRVTCGAYTSYVEPPDSIQQFSPNLAVWISNCGRPMMLDPEHWAEYMERIKKWRDKIAPGNILRLENNRYHIWGDGRADLLPGPSSARRGP